MKRLLSYPSASVSSHDVSKERAMKDDSSLDDSSLDYNDDDRTLDEQSAEEKDGLGFAFDNKGDSDVSSDGDEDLGDEDADAKYDSSYKDQAKDDSTVLTDDRSVFSDEIASSMDALREACLRIDDEDLAVAAFEQIGSICKKRFYSKTRLASSGAAEHLAQLFNHWRCDERMLLLACECISQYVNGDTDNKMALGVLNVCESLLLSLSSFQTNLKAVKSCSGLITDLCNNILKGLLKKYVKGKPKKSHSSDAFLNKIAQVAEEEDFLFCDNRARFEQAGVCSLVTNIFKAIIEAGDPSDDAMAAEISIMQAIMALSANSSLCKRFGEEGVVGLCLSLIRDRFPLDRACTALRLLTIFCSDSSTGNKLRLVGLSGCRVFVDFFHDILRVERDYVSDPLFLRVVENLSWAWLNALLACDENVQASRSVSYCKEVVESVLQMEVIPPLYKEKLQLVQKRLFYM